MLTSGLLDDGRIDHLFGILCDAPTVPNGTVKSLYSLIDELKERSAPAEVVRVVESLSAAVHKWEWALRLRDCERQSDVQDHIGALERRWAHLRRPGHSIEDAPPLPAFRRRAGSQEVPQILVSKPRRRRRAA